MAPCKVCTRFVPPVARSESADDPRQHITPEHTEKGAWLFFDGDLEFQMVDQITANHFVLVQTFKAGKPNTTKGDKGLVAPPYHIHLNQAPDQKEVFRVKQGKAVYKLDGRTGTLTPGQSITFEPGSRHTLYPAPDSTEDVIVEGEIAIKKPGAKRGVTKEFLFNLFSYMNSCHVAGRKPSKVQLAVFLDRGDLALADVPASKFLINVVLGRWIGKGLLGLRDDYYDAALHAQEVPTAFL